MQKVSEIPVLAERAVVSHKGTFGKVLIIGGQVGMCGAPALAGMAALRSGAGLVRIGVCKSILNSTAGFEPCFMTIPLCEAHGEISANAVDCILNFCFDSSITAVGPGLGTGKGARTVVNELIKQNIRLIIDADGINCLAKDNTWIKQRKASITLTPHPGEMGRIWKSLFRKQPTGSRDQQACELAEKTGCTVVLKGAGTVIADTEQYYINQTGNPGMATAGSGDVLTGMVAAVAGQGLDDFKAAQLSVYLHGIAGDMAARELGQIGMVATDILKYIPKAFKEHSKNH